MGKMRSPNYPASGLSQCINWARSLWEREKRTGVPAEVASKAIGYGGLNGPARTALSAMKKYGLLDDDNNLVRLSERGLKIVHSQESSPDYTEAIREAALLPDIFKEIFASHGDASDEALKAHLLIRKKFTDEGARQFIRAFRDTVEIAKLKESGYDNPTTPTEGFHMPDIFDFGAGPQKTKTTETRPSAQLLSFKLGKNLTAEIRLIGEDVKPSHLAGLMQYIDLTKKMLEQEEGK